MIMPELERMLVNSLRVWALAGCAGVRAHGMHCYQCGSGQSALQSWAPHVVYDAPPG